MQWLLGRRLLHHTIDQERSIKEVQEGRRGSRTLKKRSDPFEEENGGDIREYHIMQCSNSEILLDVSTSRTPLTPIQENKGNQQPLRASVCKGTGRSTDEQPSPTSYLRQHSNPAKAGSEQ